MSESTTLLLKLNKDEFLQSKVFKLQKGWILRFLLGKGVYGSRVKLVINPGKNEFIFEEPKRLEDFDSVIDYPCNTFGSFRYEFYLEDASTPSGNGYFHVLPEWNISGGKKVSLNSLSCVTHLAKLLGPLNEWKSRLQVAHEAGYNMIHLTPIQTLGISNSSYSIADYHKVNPAFGEVSFDDVGSVIKELEDEWGMLAIQDVVWNHAAKNSQWLQEHPECAYNCQNSPHLRPAYILDRALFHFSKEIASGKYESRGLPSSISAGDHLGALRYILETDILPQLKLHEFFQINVDEEIEKLKKALHENDFNGIDDGNTKIEVVQDKEFRRKQSSINVSSAKRALLTKLAYNRGDPTSEETALSELRNELGSLNSKIEHEFHQTKNAILNAILGHVSYERVEDHGPKVQKIDDSHPLVTNYFLHPYETDSFVEDEKDAFDEEKSKFLMACNGWIMENDPLKNFAEYPSMTYLKRELVCWGDCIKLNYGKNPEENPYLWDYMISYTEKCAKMFHGLRIDNCHSTPIHVAEILLSKARIIRPDLYVVAELFTGSEDMDHIFVNRLGITSLIREAQNAPDSHEQGRFVFRYGGDPVGAFKTQNVRTLNSGVAHALFFDQTHDNPPPNIKRNVFDYVPTAAMTTIAYCASGSTRGYDEFVDEKVEVHENVPFEKSETVRVEGHKISFTNFPSGSVVAFKIKPKKSTTEACGKIEEIISKNEVRDELRKTLESLSLQKLNFILFRCEKEDESEFGEGSYELPNVGKFVYSRLPPIPNPSLGPNDDEPNSLSAGLPHFSEGIWRNWGRDTFISLPGILISTGRFEDAKNIILGYSGALRHGLIPNLLGEGKCSRYNCRDSVWFWLSGIINFVEKVPQGEKILEEKVRRLYPDDDSEYCNDKEEKLYETMNEAIQKHFKGISFRERNAGPKIDEHMKDDGFTVTAKINTETGFIEGGNRWNCGTWMDKMGSSERAGNKGIPATPRDGAAVELQGLGIFVAEKLSEFHEKGLYPYSGLSDEEKNIHWSWKEWASRLRTNFKKYFYVRDDDNSEFVFRRGIIKDSVGASDGFPDYQLRPNFAITLALVPDVLTVEESWSALETASEVLLSTLGIKTLDPKDWGYDGYYNNSDQSENKKKANGWNYHQGPEWVWIGGLLLKSFLKVSEVSAEKEKKKEAINLWKKQIYEFNKCVENSNWGSLPELTNEGGSFCEGSCPAQAWSVACAIEAIETLKQIL
ncbi:hypothetical protein FO519_006887 [Halicephalobus sp. NKZ332]|nr:hypothetical protein FO519_006887 [Halicephalobus sp. NKZ332]